MASEAKRATRVAEGIREELSLLLSRQVRDPRTRGAVVSRVIVTDDLRAAKIYVRRLEGADDEEERTTLLKGLTSAAGMLRREIAQRLELRFAPELKFFYDEGQDKTQRIEELLEEVRREKTGERPVGAPTRAKVSAVKPGAKKSSEKKR